MGVNRSRARKMNAFRRSSLPSKLDGVKLDPYKIRPTK
jgi:hypothetical protein